MSLPKIVMRAMEHTVIDIGQLTADEISTLESYVQKGYLSKGKGGPYPVKKTVYAHPGYDFAGARSVAINQLLAECEAIGEPVNIEFEE